MAAAMAANTEALSKGFNKTALIPADSGRSRTLMSLCAVMMMVGIRISLLRKW